MSEDFDREDDLQFFAQPYLFEPEYTHSKKFWVKYNPALGKIWTNPAIGLFWPCSWVTAQKVGLNI